MLQALVLLQGPDWPQRRVLTLITNILTQRECRGSCCGIKQLPDCGIARYTLWWSAWNSWGVLRGVMDTPMALPPDAPSPGKLGLDMPTDPHVLF